jgi:hypothetical protein
MKIITRIPAGPEKKSPQFCGGAMMTGNRARIRKLFSRQLWPPEVDFLLKVWKVGSIRVADCPELAASLLQRDWIECDGRTVQLSAETKLLLAENGVRP